MDLHIFQNKRSRRIEKSIIINTNAYNLASYAKYITKNIYHSLKKATLDVGLLRFLHVYQSYLMNILFYNMLLY